MRGVFDAVLAGEKAPSCWIAFARRSNGIIAWVTSSEWQGLQQVQAFTDERYRQQGFMRLLIDALLVDRAMYRCMRTASFSPAVTKALVAKGFLVEEYKRQDDSWALVTTEGEAC
jgi:hypothetical protein